jgi:hypothetical protein
MADKEKGVTFVGRLANYKYFNMDDAILNALELFDKDTKNMVKTKQIDDAPIDNKKVHDPKDAVTLVKTEKEADEKIDDSVTLAKGGDKLIEPTDDDKKKIDLDEEKEDSQALKTTERDKDEEANDSESLLKDEKKVSLKTTKQEEDEEADDSEPMEKKEKNVPLKTTKQDEADEADDSETLLKDGEVEDDSKYSEQLKKNKRNGVDDSFEKEGKKGAKVEARGDNVEDSASGKLEKGTIKEKSAIKKN